MNLAEMFRHETDLLTIPARQPVFSAGEEENLMYVLMHGTADVLVGNEIVETAGPGALLGEMAMIDPAQRSATVVARDECRLFAIDVRRFDFLVQQTPHFARHVMKVMTQRLRRMDARLLEMQESPKS